MAYYDAKIEQNVPSKSIEVHSLTTKDSASSLQASSCISGSETPLFENPWHVVDELQNSKNMRLKGKRRNVLEHIAKS